MPSLIAFVLASGTHVVINKPMDAVQIRRDGQPITFVVPGKKPLDVALALKKPTGRIEFAPSVSLANFVCGLVAAGFEIKPGVLVGVFTESGNAFKQIARLFETAQQTGDSEKLRYLLQQLTVPRTLGPIQLASAEGDSASA